MATALTSDSNTGVTDAPEFVPKDPSVIDDITKKIEDAKTNYDAKPKVATKDIVDLIPVMFSCFQEMLIQLKSLNAQTAQISHENSQLKQEVKDLKGEILDLQYDAMRNQVKINGLRGLENGFSESKMVFDKLLTDLKIPNCSYTDIWRIPAKRALPGKRPNTPTLVVQFKDSENKTLFFKNLKPLKTELKDLYKIFVNHNYPAALTKTLMELEKAAKAHRNNGLLTKIKYERGGSLNLYTRTVSGVGGWQKIKK